MADMLPRLMFGDYPVRCIKCDRKVAPPGTPRVVGGGDALVLDYWSPGDILRLTCPYCGFVRGMHPADGSRWDDHRRSEEVRPVARA